MNPTKTKNRIQRRDFLKFSAGTAALAAVGSAAFKDTISAMVASASGMNADANTETVYSWCRQCALPPCGIKVSVKDGVAVKIEGHPNVPANQGTLCSRGNATLAAIYNPYRVKTPLKRTNPNKGPNEDPGFVEITWEEAYSIIADELNKVKADDPRKFLWFNGFARAGSMLEGMEFCEAFGSPNYVEVDGPNCSVHFGASLLLGNFVGARYDPAHTNYLIQMGEGSNASQGYAGATKGFANAVARGMKVVSIDPKCNIEGSKGEWIPIRPGTDLAFVLAMQHTLVHELKRIDINFLKMRTNGPYLVGPDGHYVRDPETNKPLMWDLNEGKAKPFDDPVFAPGYVPPASAAPAAGAPAAGAPTAGAPGAPAAAPAGPPPTPTFEERLAAAGLIGEFEVNGVKCVPGFQLFMQSIVDYTPEWAQEITTIPAATIRRVTTEFVDAAQIGASIIIDGTNMPLRPVSIQGGRGAITQFYGGHFHCATILTLMLVGALDVPGGAKGDLGPQHKCTPIPLALKPDADGVVAPKVEAAPREFEWPPTRLDAKTFFPYSHDNPHIVMDAILDPDKYKLDYLPEVMLAWGGNMVLRVYQQEKVYEALKKIRFIFSLAYSLDEPAWMADIVLPESGGLERVSAGSRGAMINTKDGLKQSVYGVVAQQAIKPVYDSRQPDEVFLELADRVGILYGEKGVNALLNTSKWAPVAIAEPFTLDLNKRYTSKEIANLVIKSGYGEKADVDALRNSPEVLQKVLPNKSFYPYSGFPMGQTRYAIYMDSLLRKGEELTGHLDEVGYYLPGFPKEVLMQHFSAVPRWIEKPDEPPAEYDLLGVNWKTAQFSFGIGGSADNPWLHEVSEFDPFLHVICMNPLAASQRGLNDGDEIVVESMFGKVKGKLKISQAFHHEVVGIGGFFGHTSPGMNPLALKGLHYNALMSPRVEDIDPLGGGFDGCPKVKVYKA